MTKYIFSQGKVFVEEGVIRSKPNKEHGKPVVLIVLNQHLAELEKTALDRKEDRPEPILK